MTEFIFQSYFDVLEKEAFASQVSDDTFGTKLRICMVNMKQELAASSSLSLA